MEGQSFRIADHERVREEGEARERDLTRTLAETRVQLDSATSRVTALEEEVKQMSYLSEELDTLDASLDGARAKASEQQDRIQQLEQEPCCVVSCPGTSRTRNLGGSDSLLSVLFGTASLSWAHMGILFFPQTESLGVLFKTQARCSGRDNDEEQLPGSHPSMRDSGSIFLIDKGAQNPTIPINMVRFQVPISPLSFRRLGLARARPWISWARAPLGSIEGYLGALFRSQAPRPGLGPQLGEIFLSYQMDSLLSPILESGHHSRKRPPASVKSPSRHYGLGDRRSKSVIEA